MALHGELQNFGVRLHLQENLWLEKYVWWNLALLYLQSHNIFEILVADNKRCVG